MFALKKTKPEPDTDGPDDLAEEAANIIKPPDDWTRYRELLRTADPADAQELAAIAARLKISAAEIRVHQNAVCEHDRLEAAAGKAEEAQGVIDQVEKDWQRIWQEHIDALFAYQKKKDAVDARRTQAFCALQTALDNSRQLRALHAAFSELFGIPTVPNAWADYPLPAAVVNAMNDLKKSQGNFR
jgi:hypothetical protein